MIHEDLKQSQSELLPNKGDLHLSIAIARSKQFYNLEAHLKNIKESEDVALTQDFQKMALQSDEYFSELQYPLLCNNDKLAS